MAPSAGTDLDIAWERLRGAIRECVRPCADLTSTAFMPLYNTVYTLCSPNPDTSASGPRPPSHAPQLYARLRAELFAHARAAAVLVAEALSPPSSSPRRAAAVLADAAELRNALPRAPFARYAVLWDAYVIGAKRVAALFYHLDGDWIRQNEFTTLDIPRAPVLDLHSTALVAWRDEVVTQVAPALVARALEQVASLRASRVLAGSLPPAEELALIRTLLSSIVLTGNTALLRADCNSSCSSDSDDGRPDCAPPLAPVSATLLSRDPYTALSHAERPPDPLRATAQDREPRVLRVYRTLFEHRFVEDARLFYARHTARILHRTPVRDYVRDVATVELSAELAFASSFVHESTCAPLRAALQRELVAAHRTSLVSAASALLRDASDNGLSEFRRHGMPDLRALYKLLAAERGGAAPLLQDALRRRAHAAGAAALCSFDKHDGALDALLRAGAAEEMSPAARFVHSAWRTFTTFQHVVDDAFNADPGCQRALNQACERFINAVDAAPQLLAQFMHELLERPEYRAAALDGVVRTAIPCNHDDADEWAARAARLFRYLGEKVAFQRAYAERLARRLVFATSRARTAEHRVLAKLANLCGADYTARLKRMFADVDSSAVETARFASLHNTLAFTLDVLVLSYNAWPVADDQDPVRTSAPSGNPSSPAAVARAAAASAAAARAARRRADADAFVALPGRIGVACAQFVQFYVDSPVHARRRLTWVYGLCRAWVVARDSQGNHAADLELTCAQTAIVMHFNDVEHATRRTLASVLGIPLSDVDSATAALVAARVLSGTATLSVADVPGGGCAVVRVALVASIPRIPASGTRRIRGGADGDRRTQIQAAVVRAMKSHRRMSDNQLFVLVSQSLLPWFVLDYTDLVRNVESLIENEYIERVADGYAYVA